MRRSLVLLGMAFALLLCSSLAYAFSQNSEISIDFEELYYPYTGATRVIEATVTVQESGGLTGEVTVTGPGTITPSTFTLPENGSYSKTIQVTLPADIGEYTYIATAGRINGTMMSDSETVTVYQVTMVATPTICAGGVSDNLHQGAVRARATTIGDKPVAGVEITFTIAEPIASIEGAYKPTIPDDTAETDAQGYAEVLLTSGTGIFPSGAYDQVEIVPSSKGVNFSSASFPINPVESQIEAFEPGTTTPKYFLYTGGDRVDLRATLTFQDNLVSGHQVAWSFKFWTDEQDPDTDPPVFEGTSSALYGTLTNYQGTTVNGQHTATYATGSEPGWIRWIVKDLSANEHNNQLQTLQLTKADAVNQVDQIIPWVPLDWLKDLLHTPPKIYLTFPNNQTGFGVNAQVQATVTVVATQGNYNVTVAGTTTPNPNQFTLQVGAGGTASRNVAITMPANPGTATYTASIAGTNPLVSDSKTVDVIRIDKIRLYFSHGTNSPDDAYPYTGASFQTRAVVWATHTAQTAYCDLGFDENLTWWTTGNEGPGTDGQVPPTPGTFTGTVADDWPNGWPALTIEWKRYEHETGDCVTGYNRNYWYTNSTYLANAWGENNRNYGSPGVGHHRLQTTVKMDSGTAWEQSKISTDLDGNGTADGTEYALRICPKSPNIYNAPNPPPANSAQRRNYLEWLTTYMDEPYEWGGEGYGGMIGNNVGGGDSYEGYGIDCSGLVSCGAYRAGYNWNYWRRVTSDLDAVTTAVAAPWKDNIIGGDIINWPGHHVMSYTGRTTGVAPNRNFEVIEAAGEPWNHVVWQTRPESYFVQRPGYTGRILRQF